MPSRSSRYIPATSSKKIYCLVLSLYLDSSVSAINVTYRIIVNQVTLMQMMRTTRM